MKQDRTALWVVLGITGLLICVCIFVAVGGGALYRSLKAQAGTQGLTSPIPIQSSTLAVGTTPTPVVTQSNPSTSSQTPQSPSALTVAQAGETLKTLQNTTVHLNDPIVMAERLQGKTNVALTVPAPAVAPKVGDVQQFWVSNETTNQFFQVSATLRDVGQHLYFWIENGVTYNQNAVTALVNAFDAKIYPTDRAFFGSEWTPGVDDDPRLYALYTRGLGGVTAGYFSSQDEYTPEVFKYSNAHEMFDINADLVPLSDPYVYSTFAHEFQHMIHWNTDRNEDIWLNEGFSVLAQHINGYTVGGFDQSYAANPDTQLNDWSLDQNADSVHYGASFLYLDYLLGRFGKTVTQAVVNSPLHGLASIDAVLSELGIKDPQTGSPVTADSLFGDWTVANYLQDSKVGDGRYAYPDYAQAPKVQSPTEKRGSCPFAPQQTQVHQYGADYIDIYCKGNFTLQFSGATTAPLVPVQAYSGSYDFWSNKGDQSDMTLTRSFDFTQTSSPITLTYHTWYDLEDGYDFAYLEGSLDGKAWQVIKTPACSSDNSSGNNYGCGYTGSSQAWIEQTVDLSAYAGKKVELRFEYLTDAALNGEGLLLDDIQVPQIGYSTDFEKDDGGWQADGFARVQNVLPQTFRVSLILEGKKTTVQTITLDANQSAHIPLSLGGDVTQAILVVSGTTRFTRQEATYQVSAVP